MDGSDEATERRSDEGKGVGLPRARGVVEEGMRQGLHVGAQVFISLRGRIVEDWSIGIAREGVPMRPDTLMIWLSSCKPVTAVAVVQQWERGNLELDDRVAKHIPEFGQRGKENITVRHVLTHTGGFRGSASNFNPLPWESIIERICDAPIEPGWTPGRTAGYHVAAGWYILGEIVRRLDGRPLEQYVREEIFEPAGMHDSWMGMPAERYRNYGQRIGIMQETSTGATHPHVTWDTKQTTTLCRPGANGRGPMRELALFYETMLNGGLSPKTGRRILSPQAGEAMTARHRTGLSDRTFNHIVDVGLGFIINSAMYGPESVPYGYGPHASPRTFGHGGSQSSAGFADPEHGLAVAFVFNGTPGEAKHQRRLRAFTAAIYEDLGLMWEIDA